jgi:hypothetical protein
LKPEVHPDNVVACTAVAMQRPRDNANKQTVTRQRLVKHVPAARNTHETIGLLLKTVFSARSMQRGYEEDVWSNPVSRGFSSE